MFIPNSPSPPRGITLSVCVVLLKKYFSPLPNLKSYHTAPIPAADPLPAAHNTCSAGRVREPCGFSLGLVPTGLPRYLGFFFSAYSAYSALKLFLLELLNS